MKVKLLIGRGGPTVSNDAGDIVEVSDEEARRMIAAGQCEPVTVKETATKKPATQKAVKA